MDNLFYKNIKNFSKSNFDQTVNIFFPELIEKDGCIFIKQDSNHLRYNLIDYHDKTDFESFINHYHIEDFKYQDPKFIQILVKTWQINLHEKFPHKKFIIYLINNEIIRFHQIHNKEPLWFEIDDKKGLKEHNIQYFIVE